MPKVTKDTTFAQFDKAESQAGTKKRKGPAEGMHFKKADGGGFISDTDHRNLAPQAPGGYGDLHTGPTIHKDLAELHGHIDKMFGDVKKPSKHSKAGTTGEQAAAEPDDD